MLVIRIGSVHTDAGTNQVPYSKQVIKNKMKKNGKKKTYTFYTGPEI